MKRLLHIAAYALLACSLVGCNRVRPISDAMSSSPDTAGTIVLRYTKTLRNLDGGIIAAPKAWINNWDFRDGGYNSEYAGSGPNKYLPIPDGSGVFIVEGGALWRYEHASREAVIISPSDTEDIVAMRLLDDRRLLICGRVGGRYCLAELTAPKWAVGRKHDLPAEVLSIRPDGFDLNRDKTKILIMYAGPELLPNVRAGLDT